MTKGQDMAETNVAVEVTAWDDEDSYAIVLGTHDAEAGRAAYLAWLESCGFKPGDDEWSPDADRVEFFDGMRKYWTEPKDDEEPFDKFTEAGEGRVPWMFAELGFEA